MKRYELNQFFLGALLAIALLFSGCSVTPETEEIPDTVTAPKQEIKKPPAKPQPGRSNNPQAATVKPTIQQANQLMKKGQREQAADVYYRAAFSYPSPQRDRIILQAAEITASMGNEAKTNAYLKAAKLPALDANNQTRYRYIQSLLALHNKQADRALNLLPRETTGLSKGLRDKIELVRQKAVKMGGKYATTPAKPTSKVTTSTPTSTARQNQLTHYNMPPVLQQPTQTQQQQAASQQDQQQPANPGYALPQSTNKIAVLLPEQGALGKVGDEIYQGIKVAQAKYGANTLSKRYNVNKNNALEQYQQAVADGADIVVGPLDKDSLATLMTRPQALRVPLLSLNYLTGAANIPSTLYQFGLSPEDEARQIAEMAINRQQLNGIIMAPDSSWGKRLAAAFAESYQQRGGTILNTEFYPPSSPTTYLKRVQALLSRAAGTNMAFLAASPTQARLLRPLLKDQAGLLPVYATSHIFSGRQASADDTDLDGIIYTEIPWVLNNQSSESLEELQYPRLYALGMDAVMIAKSLPQLAQSQTLAGQTGKISMTPQHRIQRQLEFATFINGEPERLGN
ncbi:MAG: penicillin-binding protein activator [Thiolinea sp.]